MTNNGTAVGAAGWALAVMAKATSLLVVAGAVHLLVGRRRALLRSSLWNACLVGLLLIPAASVAFPRYRLPVLAARTTPPPIAPGPASRPVGMSRDDPADEESAVDRMRSSRPEPIAANPVSVLPAEAPSRAVADPGRFEAGRWAVGGYLGVVGLLLARLVAALRAVNRLRRDARPVLDAAWLQAVEGWRTRLGIARPVALAGSSRVAVPVVVGWLRPMILVPEALLAGATSELRDAVLLHELAHVRRGDYGWNLVRKLVQAVYWPHPLLWPLSRVLGTVREQACDDLCVHILGGATGYRASLLAVASTLVRRPEIALGLAMARPTHLARRLAWIDRTPGAPLCLLRRPARVALRSGVVVLSGTPSASSADPPASPCDQAWWSSLEPSRCPSPQYRPPPPPRTNPNPHRFRPPLRPTRSRWKFSPRTPASPSSGQLSGSRLTWTMCLERRIRMARSGLICRSDCSQTLSGLTSSPRVMCNSGIPPWRSMAKSKAKPP